MKDNKPVGRVVEGDLPALVNKRADANGILWSDRGEAIGKCEPLSDKEIDEFLKESSPFESFPNNIITAEGMVEADGVPIGIVKEGDVKQLRGKSCDADGEVTDRMGNVIGRCERWEPEPEAEAEPEPEPEAEDLSLLDGGIVTRAGYIENGGRVVGKVVDENFSHLVGKRCDKNGIIWLHGEAQGHARLLDESERDEVSAEDAPFESFPNAVVGEDGWIVSDGQVIGKLVSGDPKALRGRSVDAQGRISDKWGRDLGKAERWEAEPEPEPEATDYSSLAGKRVNKLGFLVDSNGSIFGRVVEGDLKTMVGRMANAKGEILSEGGIPIGRAELVSESEREGLKEGPFSGLSGLSVGKDSYVVDAEGQIVGKLVSGDPKKLQGRAVDEQGEITDSNGNVIGRAEPYTPEEEEVSKHPLSGFRVNSKGDVIDPNTGELAGKLITGDLKVCAGKLIDDEGDVVSKGTVIGHVAILSEIHDEEETETEDEKTKRQQTDEDRKLAIQMAACIEQCLDKVRPICKMITEKLDAADRKRQEEEEVDEEALVREVKPLLEEGNMILSECNGAIRALDPGGRIAEGAKYKAAARESTPEEHRLAELITTLTQTVTETLENAKRRLEGLPRAKKELNPLLGLLGEPLGQIIAGVGFLLAGVLNLVGRLLQGLGLGQILDSLLGTLGLSRVLEGLGLGGITGKKDKKKKSGGGLLGGLLG
ncbi:hypothetical protein GQ53DRAFT_689637 [Thozetella sp. PMI_491]|nr:hypothetical protein GQ53DRAFT_689637 [Thozetella sp. PMI_491]